MLGWFSPATIKLKILFQRLWELKLEWDDTVPLSVKTQWLKWRTELPLLANCHIARCYFPRDSFITSWQLHGFSNASELAFAGVVYLRMIDTNENVHVSLVTSKTKVAPIKRLSIPRNSVELNCWHVFSITFSKCFVSVLMISMPGQTVPSF